MPTKKPSTRLRRLADHELLQVRDLYVKLDVPSDQLSLHPLKRLKFRHLFRTLGFKFTVEQAAHHVVNLRKRGSLPRLRHKEGLCVTS